MIGLKPMYISHVRLRNWRNFQSVDVDMGNRVFLVGPNASGKSNFLDVFRFLHDITKSGGGLQKAISERGGIDNIRCLASHSNSDIEISVSISDTKTDDILYNYAIGITQDRLGNPYLSYERVCKGHTLILDRPNGFCVEDDEYFMRHTHIEIMALNRCFVDVFKLFNTVAEVHSEEDEENIVECIFGMLDDIHKHRLDHVGELVQTVIPIIEQFEYKYIEGAQHIQVRYAHWREGATQYEDQFSDGTLQLIGLLWALLDENSLLLLEEPESHLNVGIVAKIPAMTHRHHRHGQVIISTHNTDILSDLGIGGEEVLIFVPSPEGTIIQVASSIPYMRHMLESGLSVAAVIMPTTRE